MKSIYIIVSFFILLICFQNFKLLDSSGNLLAVNLEPEYLIINKSTNEVSEERSISSSIRRSNHDAKIENPSDFMPEIFEFDRDTKVLRFKSNLNSNVNKSRSEIRVKGADVHFSDSDEDQFHYTSFEIFIPKDQKSNFPRSKTWVGDWNIIWQCAQEGSSDPFYYRDASPPLSLQLYENRVYLRSMHDYYKWYRKVDKITLNPSNQSVYSNWQRRRVSKENNSPEIEEDSQVINSPITYIGYLNLNSWNRVFMKFKMGENGLVRIWFNDRLVLHREEPIGYRTADDPLESNPKFTDASGNQHIKKRCSARFGLYQGYGKKNDPSNAAVKSEVLFRNFAIGTDWNAVKFND